jgi:hypothetical protein
MYLPANAMKITNVRSRKQTKLFGQKNKPFINSSATIYKTTSKPRPLKGANIKAEKKANIDSPIQLESILG